MKEPNWDRDFPLAHVDRNWELVRYSWDERTGWATFAYCHRFTDARLEEKRYQGKYVQVAPESKWIPRGLQHRAGR